MTDYPGLDRGAMTEWLAQNITQAEPPFSFELIAGGRSNLTYAVTDANGRKTVLRRPPASEVLATAHDMGREHRVMSALGRTDVPVPTMLGFCEDSSVTGAPFYVMDFVAGAIVRTQDEARALSESARAGCGVDMATVLADLHRVDPADVGLGELGKPSGYVERQLRRWSTQLSHTKTRELQVVDEVHERLVSAIPAQTATGIVHGDFRLDNVVIDSEAKVAAVLDWELCTLGDPRADIGLLMVYWAEPDDEMAALGRAPTAVDGFADRATVLGTYESARGEAVENLDYFIALGYWKLACILEGVLSRYRAGAMGEDARAEAEDFAEQVVRLGDAADKAATKAGI